MKKHIGGELWQQLYAHFIGMDEDEITLVCACGARFSTDDSPTLWAKHVAEDISRERPCATCGGLGTVGALEIDLRICPECGGGTDKTDGTKAKQEGRK